MSALPGDAQALPARLGWRDSAARILPLAWPVFIAGAVVYTALGGPRQVLAFSCGFLFGGWQGGLIGTLLGILFAVLVAKGVLPSLDELLDDIRRQNQK